MWKRKAELFRFSDWALLFLFAKFFSRQCRTEGQTSVSFWLCRGLARKEICQSFFFKVGQRARLVCLPASVESSFEEKVHSQSALVHKLMRSGFFICQIFGEGRGVRNVTTGTSHQAWMLEGLFVKKICVANSTQCSQAVTHPSTD